MAVKPLVVEKTLTIVSRTHGRVRALSACPPPEVHHRSAVKRYRDRRAIFIARGKIFGESRSHGLETWLTATFYANVGHTELLVSARIATLLARASARGEKTLIGLPPVRRRSSNPHPPCIRSNGRRPRSSRLRAFQNRGYPRLLIVGHGQRQSGFP